MLAQTLAFYSYRG